MSATPEQPLAARRRYLKQSIHLGNELHKLQEAENLRLEALAAAGADRKAEAAANAFSYRPTR